MRTKLYALSALAMLSGLMFSCEEKEIDEVLVAGPEQADYLAGTNLVFAETFESPVAWYTAQGTDFSGDSAFAVVGSPVFKGDRAARFALSDTSSMVSQGTRAEVTIVKEAVQKEMWYSFAAFFPSSGYAYDSEKEIISQWHQASDTHLGEKSQSPASQLVVSKDRFTFDTGFNDAAVSKGVLVESRQKIDLGPVVKDTWHSFVFHFVHSYQSDGLVEVWHNGVKILSHSGGNMYNNAVMPKWKLGIYKWKWNGDGTTDTHKRVLYFDNIKVGNAQASLAEMMPDNVPPTKDPTPDPIASLMLINSHTDTEVASIQDGDTLRLSALGTNKLNIVARNESQKAASIKFVLTGPRLQTYADNVRPFALFGDDGLGNYFYGKGMLAGHYTLVATPYSEPKGRGVAGLPSKISFTVIP
ncbi:MAG: polysaccharide lyase [Adhaeribacter sp.]